MRISDFFPIELIAFDTSRFYQAGWTAWLDGDDAWPPRFFSSRAEIQWLEGYYDCQAYHCDFDEELG